MKLKFTKRTFDILFIFTSTAILLILQQFDFLKPNVGFALIPIIIAYQIGQFSQRKFKSKAE